MRIPMPHFLLLAEAQTSEDTEGWGEREGAGQWRFVLEATDGSTVLEAEECEGQADAERLELLAVVRGLEALDQPSRVTLVTSSRYVSHGLRVGMAEWRDNEWQWERFGEMTPVKNGDLWQRVDQALHFHSVDCRTWRVDRPHGDAVAGLRARNRRSPARGDAEAVDAVETGPSPPVLRLALLTTDGESRSDGEGAGRIGDDSASPPRLAQPPLRIYRGRRKTVSAWRRWSLSLQWWWRRLSWHGSLPAA